MTRNEIEAADRMLAQHISDGVERTLKLAQTWLGWDGRPRIGEDPSRIYTPHKALRRYIDHLLDHLAQIEGLLAGAPTEPDRWHGSLLTVDTDWARFTEADLDEVGQRLHRLDMIFRLRLETAGPHEWDKDRGQEWTIRQIVEHVADPWYAEQVGDLRQPMPA
jgi:hypothetical protein